MSSPHRWSFDLYTRGQQRVIGVMGVVIVGVYTAINWWPFRQPYFPEPEDLVAHAARLTGQAEPGTTGHPTMAAASFFFDPNTVTEVELVQLGLNEKQAASWLKYRGNRPNAFPEPESIAKLYVLDTADVARLLPLIRMEAGGYASTTAKGPVTDREAPPHRKAESFPFDPNTVNAEALQRLGLSERQAAGFLRYRERMDRPFRSAEDLDRIRLLSGGLGARLKSLVRIENEPSPPADAGEDGSPSGPRTYGGVDARPPEAYSATTTLAPGSIDVNLASAAEFQLIPGVGPYWAGRFLKFRDALGGFIGVEQLGETYGLPDSLRDAMVPYLNNTTPVTPWLRINQLPAEELAAHPYISRKLADIMVKFRAQHGPFRKRSDLERIRILDAPRIDRLLPYLDFREE